METNESNLKQIGTYPLLARLGSGGMGTVYLALHRGMGGFEKKVAIKALLPHFADDKQFIGMLVDEAKLTAQLTHPNIVQVIDLVHAGQTHFLVMEYVEGIDARTLSSEQDLTLDEAVYLIAEAARGLAYAHRKCGPQGEMLGIVHRDISGHNLLVSVEGVTKVMDFGIAKAASNRNATEVGVLKGKLAYMSPEQALGRVLDARSDLFSLGIVLWEMCTRQRLFPGDTQIQVLLKVQKCEIEPPSRLVDGFPRELEDIILKCLSINPEHRYSDGDRLADELQGFLRSHQGAVHPRSKLAQRVSEYLRKHPLVLIEKSSMPISSELTLASSRNERTRISSPVGPGQRKSSSPRRHWRWISAALFWAVMGGLTWSAKGRQSPPLPLPERVATAALLVPNVIPPAVEPREILAPAEISHAVLQVTEPVSLPTLVKVKAAKVPRPSSTLAKPAALAMAVKAASAPAGVNGMGYVSINATPWARVYIDGIAVAESTPLLQFALTAGDHKIVLVNPELKLRKELHMSILPGEHFRQKITLK